MIDANHLKEALCGTVLATTLEDGVRITTHCLYPSNGTVSVVVRGGINQFVVTDDGGALAEAASSGLLERASDKQIRGLLKVYGLHVKGGAIYSPAVSKDEVAAAILLVSNAAKEVASWSLGHLRFEAKRNFKAELAALLHRHFQDNLKSAPIVGASNRPYNFEHVIYLPRGRRLLIDPVVNDPSSINARVVANLDVQMAKNAAVQQLIVYDDQLEWSSADLKVLEVGAPTIPFSLAEREIERLAA